MHSKCSRHGQQQWSWHRDFDGVLFHQREGNPWHEQEHHGAAASNLGIHSKSESRDSNNPARKFELSANLSKNATKWPKNDPKWTKVAQIWPHMALEWPNMIQSGPKLTQNGPKLPKWPKNDARINALFPQFFFNEKAVPQTFSLLECMYLLFWLTVILYVCCIKRKNSN